MTISDFYQKLQTIIENYYNKYDDKSEAESYLKSLITEAEKSGLEVRVTPEILDTITPYSSYDTSYSDDSDYTDDSESDISSSYDS